MHPEEAIRDSLLAFIFGAQDTTSAALSWLFYLLSRNPLVEMKMREEISKNVAAVKEGEKWEISCTEEVSNLGYLRATLCDTLRLSPKNQRPK